MGAEDRAEEILTRAFANRYDLSFTAIIRMEISAGNDEPRTRELDVATIHDGATYRAMGQLRYPNYLRGMAILSISETDGHQAFVYLPSQDRVRRISITHKDDAFLGSDLTYEDFERRRVEDCELSLMPASRTQNEEVHVIACRPKSKLNYDRSEYDVAKSDYAILEIREYKDGKSDPSRVMMAPRSKMETVDGHVLATYLEFHTKSRGTSTTVTFDNLRAKRVDDRILSVSSLARDTDLGQETRCRPGECD